MPDNIDDNPDDDLQEIIQDRIKALDLLTSGIQELTQNYTSRFENNNTSKTNNDGMSDLTTDETSNYIQKIDSQTLQNQPQYKKHDVDQKMCVTLEEFKKQDKRYPLLTDSEKHLLKLYKLCINNNVPQAMFDTIIKIFRDAYIANEEITTKFFNTTEYHWPNGLSHCFLVENQKPKGK